MHCMDTFKSWLEDRGMSFRSPLEMSSFPLTGRGMKATKDISENELIVDVPYALLVTKSKLMEEYLHMESL